MNRNDLMDVDMAVLDFLRDHPNAPMAQIIRAAVEAAEPLMRAQVEALPAVLLPGSTVLWLNRDEALALFDGSSDD